jgi:hypothetical protein
MTRPVALFRDQRGASAAEFALVLPLLLILLLGMLDAGRFLWEYNRAEKATQMGVRYAVATDPIAPGLASFSFAVDAGVIAGDPIPVGEFDYADCDDSDCDPCVGGDICDAIGYDSAAFANLVARMNYMYPAIESENVKVKYRNVGLGYAGDPNGPDVAPLVTVRLTGMTFQPITTLLFGLTMSMPDFRASLTLEDGSGTVAN